MTLRGPAKSTLRPRSSSPKRHFSASDQTGRTASNKAPGCDDSLVPPAPHLRRVRTGGASSDRGPSTRAKRGIGRGGSRDLPLAPSGRMPTESPRRRSTPRWGPATVPPRGIWHQPWAAPPGRRSVAVPAIERVSTCFRPAAFRSLVAVGPIVRSGSAVLGSRAASSRCGRGSGSGTLPPRTLRAYWAGTGLQAFIAARASRGPAARVGRGGARRAGASSVAPRCGTGHRW